MSANYLPMANIDSMEHLADALEQLASVNFSGWKQQDGYEIGRRRALAALKRLNGILETPIEMSRRVAWQEPAHVAAIKIALNMGLLEQLNRHGDHHGLSVQQLAKATNANEELVGRILRHLGAWSVLCEIDKDQYAPTETSIALLDPKVNSGIDYWIYLSAVGMSHLPRFIENGGYERGNEPGKGNWEQATGTGQHFFAWLNEHPDALRAFTSHLQAFTEGRASWISMFPVEDRLIEGADPNGPLIVDVGGGVGQDVQAFQDAYPQGPGRLFLQDLQQVISQSTAGPEIEKQAYDFFSPQPVRGARAYLLHYVLHDWPDETCLKILANIKDAMRPKYSKLLIAEFVVASKGADPFNTALDITVMTVVGAKERTEEDWKKLIEKAGLQIVEINSLPGDHESVIEVGLVGES